MRAIALATAPGDPDGRRAALMALTIEAHDGDEDSLALAVEPYTLRSR
ncbi:MAG: hypothetical protein JWO31_1193 [Phycisphaerales bacterium]|nr:hypothetical protein [Phycisphaerales bacterium]